MDVTREAIDSAYENDHSATTVHLAAAWLADHPDDLGVIGRYADMLYQMTRYDEAIELLTNAIEKQDADLPRHLLFLKMGSLERYRGNFAEAEAWFRKAIELRSDDATG